MYLGVLQAELRQHLELCLPSLASDAAAAAGAAPAAPCVATGAGAAAGALPAAPHLSVRQHAPPSQPRTAVRPAPGSAGAMSRKRANAYFSPSRPRDVGPADGDAAAAAAGPGESAAAPARAADATTGGDEQAAAAAIAAAAAVRHQQQAEPMDEDAAPAVNGTGAAPPPPPSPPALENGDAPEASSPAASPQAAPLVNASPPAGSPPAASPPQPPPHGLDKVCAAACRAALQITNSHAPSSHRCARQDALRHPPSEHWRMAVLGGAFAPGLPVLCC